MLSPERFGEIVILLSKSRRWWYDVSQAGANVGEFEFGEILQNFGFRHAFCQHCKNVIDRNAQAADTGSSAPLAWFEGDAFRNIRLTFRRLDDKRGNFT